MNHSAFFTVWYFKRKPRKMDSLAKTWTLAFYSDLKTWGWINRYYIGREDRLKVNKFYNINLDLCSFAILFSELLKKNFKNYLYILTCKDFLLRSENTPLKSMFRNFVFL